MPFHIDRFMGSPAVQAMHPCARIGYIYLLACAWQTENCTISNDPLELAENSGLGDELWSLHGPRILRKFEPVEDGRLRNTVCFDEWSEAKRIFEKNHLPPEEVREKRSAAGRKGNAVRWPANDSQERGKELRSKRMAEARNRGTHTSEHWGALLAFCGKQCLRCGDVNRLVKDHIIPIYQGGSDGLENIQPLCAKCNSSKGRENLDFRPTNWRECLTNALLNSSNGSQTPRHASQTTVVPVDVPVLVSKEIEPEMLAKELPRTLGLAAGFGRGSLYDALYEIAKIESEAGRNLEDVAVEMEASYRLYEQEKPSLQIHWNPKSFFGDGHWRNPGAWPRKNGNTAGNPKLRMHRPGDEI